MRYENPRPVEHVNYSQEHPLKEFGQLVLGVAVLIITITILLNFTAGYLAKHIPFSFEQKMVGEMTILDSGSSAQTAQLQALADRLSEHMALPEGMQITVHYDESDTVNALATLGGHVLFFQGLLDEIESEQELAAVMAHEIAHVKHRHPVVALGKGFTLAALAGFVGGASGSTAGEWLIGSTSSLSLLQFSRQQESDADATAARALFAVYGHIGGADELFKKFSRLESENLDTSAGIELFRSHPYSKDRWGALKAIAHARNWPIQGALTPWKAVL
ncbi:MAG: putative Zn-dependent protease [Cryomorphaceae bacterium]|jgi:predicted Zn-dependent protease